MRSDRNLILITNQYPHAEGDAPFVEAEITSLAARFTRIYIWTATPSRAPLVEEMPSNVYLMGSLSETTPLRTVLSAFRPTLLPAFVSLLLREVFDRRRQVQLPRLIRSAALAVVGGHRLQYFWRTLRGRGEEWVIYSFWGSDGAFALLTLKDKPALCVVRVHGYDLYEERVGYLSFRRKLFAQADIILTVSAHGAAYLKQKYSGNTVLPPVIVARLGTEDRGGSPDGSASVINIVSCSSLVDFKRVDLIQKTLERLSQDKPVRWVHFGDGPMRAELEARAEVAGPNLDVHFAGNVPNSKLMSYYQSESVSAFVNLSTTEGLPISIMEAISFDIPVLATDVGGTGEIIREELGSGILIPPVSSVEEIADALMKLLESDDWHPRSVWEDLCSAKKNGEAVAALLSTDSNSIGEPSLGFDGPDTTLHRG